MFLYNLGIFFYRLLIGLLSPFHAKAGKMMKGRTNLFRDLENFSKTRAGKKLIWVHAASLGEFEQGRPVMEELKKKYPDAQILLTFFSPSGFDVQKNYKGADAVVYIPFDTAGNAKKFLDLVKPDVAIFIKYEFWLNFITEMKNRNISLYLIAAVFHPAQPFFKWYGNAWRKAIRYFKHVFVQDEESLQLLKKLNPASFSLTGDTRYDRVMQIKESGNAIPDVQGFCSTRFTIVLGSSYKEEEEMMVNLFSGLKKINPSVNILVAPHEIHTSNITRIKNLFASSDVAAFTEQKEFAGEILILDTMGMLSSAYRNGKIAVIGGGFGNGIHNILEAAVYGMPVLFGPNYKRFSEAREMVACGCAFSFSGPDDLNTLLEKFLTDEKYHRIISAKAAEFVADRAGSTKKVMEKISLN